MLLKCERCGAPLEVPSGASVRCPYCGTTATAAAPAPPPQQPLPPGPGYRHGQGAPPPRVHYPVVVPQRSRAGTIFVWALSLVGVLGGLAASMIPRLTASGSPALQALGNAASNAGQALSPTRALSPTSWSSADRGCLIDANGDGVLDIAGLTGPSEPNLATVVDGKSGAVLFTGPAVAKATQLGCLGANQGFFVVQGNFQIDFYTARSPWGATHVMARDKVSEFAVGPGCVQLKTEDGTTQGVQLPSGVAAACASGLMRRCRERAPGLMGLTDHGTELSVGARKYTLTKRESGTEILTVKVSEGARSVWARELPYASCTFGAGIAVAPGKILLWAAHAADRDKGLLVGLDEQTGNQLYEIPIPDTSSDSPEFFRYNGQYVLAVNWGALRAYDPASGSEVWRVGR